MEEVKYIPGDLVKITPHVSVREANAVFRIGMLLNMKTRTVNKVKNESVEFIVLEKNIKPIPLTPEILKKNGWVKEIVEHFSGNYEAFINKSNHIMIRQFNSCLNIYLYDGIVMSGVKFVHQLQHLLFGLGLSSDLKV